MKITIFKTRLLHYLLLAVIFNALILTPAIAQTQSVANQALNGAGEAGKAAGYSESAPPVQMAQVLVNIINVLLGFTGIVFLILLIYGGFLWMTARGNEDQVAKAKKIVQEVIIGLIIILVSRMFTEFILTQFAETIPT